MAYHMNHKANFCLRHGHLRRTAVTSILSEVLAALAGNGVCFCPTQLWNDKRLFKRSRKTICRS